MAILAKSNGGEYERCPIGMQPAVCCGIIDVGTHDVIYNGQTKKQHQVVFLFELEAKMTQGENAGKPFMRSKKYTLSLHEKSSLSKDLESWLSRKMNDEQRKNGIDLEKFYGRNCTLNIVESEYQKKTYVNVNTILPPMPDKKLAVTIRDIPEWVVTYKNKSDEEKEKANLIGNGQNVDNDAQFPQDDLPF